LRAIALARVILDDDVTVQAPPNLSRSIAPLVDAGINDLGGISPLTPDFINREHAWPHLDGLARACEALGRPLRPRPPVQAGWRCRREGGRTHEGARSRARR